LSTVVLVGIGSDTLTLPQLSASARVLLASVHLSTMPHTGKHNTQQDFLHTLWTCTRVRLLSVCCIGQLW